MSLTDRVREAREAADCSDNPSIHAVRNALEGALYAEAKRLIDPPQEIDTGDLPPPYDSIAIRKPPSPEPTESQ